jgi:hypothetical protein
MCWLPDIDDLSPEVLQRTKQMYVSLDEDDRRMVRELMLRLSRKAQGLKRKVVYVEDDGHDLGVSKAR